MMHNKVKRKETSCGIIPVYEDKNGERKFLLLLQNNLHWSFPKGHVEKGESFLETAKRELSEETGLVAQKVFSDKMFSHSYVVEYDNEILDKTVHYFVAEIENDDVHIQEEEIKDYAWCTLDEVYQKLQFDDIKKLFKEISEYYRW